MADWGALPHHYALRGQATTDDHFALELSVAMTQFQNQPRRYCPFILSVTTMDTFCRSRISLRDNPVEDFMDRFSERFSQRIQCRIARNEATPPDIQVKRLLNDCVLKSPLAPVLTAMTVFRSVQRLNEAYDKLLAGTVFRPTGEAIPGRALDRAMDRCPKSAIRILFH